MKLNKLATIFLAGAALSLSASLAHADINIGVVASTTGPGAALGIDVKRASEILPATINGQKVHVVFLDDATDPTTAAKDAHKLITEDHVDAMIGPIITPNALSMIPVAAAAKVPMIALAPVPVGANTPWAFRAAHGVDLMVGRDVEHMVANKVRTVAYIGFADAYGDLVFKELSAAAKKAGIKVVADERFKRPDTTITAQVLKIVAAHPDAVMVGASGTPAILPHATLLERGYHGPVYETHAVANKDFVRVGGKVVEGALIPVGGLLVDEQLPASNPSKAPGAQYLKVYEHKFGPESRSMFAGYTQDSFNLLAGAMTQAMKKGLKPGTPAFRQAVRDNLETTRNFVGVTGVYNFSKSDHSGLDARSRVLVKVVNGKWQFVK